MQNKRDGLKTDLYLYRGVCFTVSVGDGITQWLACSTNDCEVGVRVLLAAGDHIAAVGQLLFAPWAWAYSTLHPFGVGK